jgi:hypothetical protein
MNPYRAFAAAVADVARLAAQQDDRARNVLGVTDSQLAAAKKRLEQALEQAIANSTAVRRR